MQNYKHMKKGPKRLKSDTVVRKKMHKKGKNWITLATTLTLLVGMGVSTGKQIVFASEAVSNNVVEKSDELTETGENQNQGKVETDNQEKIVSTNSEEKVINSEEKVASVMNRNIAEGQLDEVVWKIDQNGVLHFGKGHLKEISETKANPFLSIENKVKEIHFDDALTVEKNALTILENLKEITNIIGLENIKVQTSDAEFHDFTVNMNKLNSADKEKLLELFKSDAPEEKEVADEPVTSKNEKSADSTERKVVEVNKPQDSSNKNIGKSQLNTTEKNQSAFRSAPIEKTNQMVTIKMQDNINVVDGREVVETSDIPYIQSNFDVAGDNAKIDGNGFHLTTKGVEGTKGYITLNSGINLTQPFSIGGFFNFNTTWSRDNIGSIGNDGVGLLITNESFDNIKNGRSGGTLGVYGLDHTLFAGIDTYYNSENNKFLEKDISSGLNTSFAGTNFGGYNGGQKQSVLKFLDNFSSIDDVTTNTKNEIVKTPSGDNVATPYLPASNNGKIGENEKYEISWEPIGNAFNKSGSSYIKGKLTVSFTGADITDPNKYSSSRRTISKEFTFSTSASIGLISSNGEQTDDISTTVTSLKFNKSTTNVNLVFKDKDGNVQGKTDGTSISLLTGDTFSFGTEGAEYLLNLPDEFKNYRILKDGDNVDKNESQLALGKEMTYVIQEPSDEPVVVEKELNFKFVNQDGDVIKEFKSKGEVGTPISLEDLKAVKDFYKEYEGNFTPKLEDSYSYGSKNETITFKIGESKIIFRFIKGRKIVEEKVFSGSGKIIMGTVMEIWNDVNTGKYAGAVESSSIGSLDIPNLQTLQYNEKPTVVEIKLVNDVSDFLNITYVDSNKTEPVFLEQSEIKEESLNYPMKDMYSEENLKGNFENYVYLDDPLQKDQFNGLNQKISDDTEFKLMEVKAKGTWGTAKWYIDMDGVAHIGGKDLNDKDAQNNKADATLVPWRWSGHGGLAEYAADIKKVIIENPLFVIGKQEYGDDRNGQLYFDGLTNLKELEGFDKLVFDSHDVSLNNALSSASSLEKVKIENETTKNVMDYHRFFAVDNKLQEVVFNVYTSSAKSKVTNDDKMTEPFNTGNRATFDALRKVTFGWRVDKMIPLPNTFADKGYNWYKTNEEGKLTNDSISLKDSAYAAVNNATFTNIYKPEVEKLKENQYVTYRLAKELKVNYVDNAKSDEDKAVKSDKFIAEAGPLEGGKPKEVPIQYTILDMYATEQMTGPFTNYVYLDDPLQINQFNDLNKNLLDDIEFELMEVQAKGTWGSVKWYIDMEGTLHLGPGTGVSQQEIGESTDEKGNIKIVFPQSPWLEHKDVIKQISVDGKVNLPENSNSLFGGLELLENIDKSENLNFSKVRDMSFLFEESPLLTSVDVSKWDVSNVENMKYAFGARDTGAHPIQVVPEGLASWNTSKVTDMSYMFFNNFGVKELDLSTFDTSQVTDMRWMFGYNNWSDDKSIESQLQSLNLEGWDISKVTNFDSTFYNLQQLMTLNMDNWKNNSKEPNITTIRFLINRTPKIKRLDLSQFKVKSDANTDSTFGYNDALKEIIFGNQFLAQPELPNTTDITKWRNVADGLDTDPQGDNWFDTYSGKPDDADTYVLGEKPEDPFENIIPQTGSKQSALLYGFSGLMIAGLALFEGIHRKKETDKELKDFDGFLNK